MDYRVIRFFIDRDTLKGYNAGDLFPCDDPERAQQLINKCYIERIADKAEDKPKEPKKTTTAKAKGTAKKAASKKKA